VVDEAGRDRAAPAPLTDDDVEAMARGKAGSVARRIAKHSPSGRTGKLTDDKASPAEITAAEMRRIQPRGRLTKAIRERLAAAAPADEPAEPVAKKKQSPDRTPDER
jgi:hypothetical protein